MNIVTVRRYATAAVLLVAFAVTASAQNSESVNDRVERLYASAEYEQALALLDGARDRQGLLYRALCMFALGRDDEARTAVESLVAAAPDFIPSAEEVPPRLVALVTTTRRAVLPGVMRKIFEEARQHYQAKAPDRAMPLFQEVLRLASASDVRDLEGAADLRVLSQGFIDLGQATQAAPLPPAPAATIAPVPAQRSSAVPVAARVLRQEIPPWPAELGPRVPGATGAVRVQIDNAGRVTGATMVKSINPRYDTRLLSATRYWQYEPATINGIPIPSESVVQVQITAGSGVR